MNPDGHSNDKTEGGSSRKNREDRATDKNEGHADDHDSIELGRGGKTRATRRTATRYHPYARPPSGRQNVGQISAASVQRNDVKKGTTWSIFNPFGLFGGRATSEAAEGPEESTLPVEAEAREPATEACEPAAEVDDMELPEISPTLIEDAVNKMKSLPLETSRKLHKDLESVLNSIESLNPRSAQATLPTTSPAQATPSAVPTQDKTQQIPSAQAPGNHLNAFQRRALANPFLLAKNRSSGAPQPQAPRSRMDMWQLLHRAKSPLTVYHRSSQGFNSPFPPAVDGARPLIPSQFELAAAPAQFTMSGMPSDFPGRHFPRMVTPLKGYYFPKPVDLLDGKLGKVPECVRYILKAPQREALRKSAVVNLSEPKRALNPYRKTVVIESHEYSSSLPAAAPARSQRQSEPGPSAPAVVPDLPPLPDSPSDEDEPEKVSGAPSMVPSAATEFLAGPASTAFAGAQPAWKVPQEKDTSAKKPSEAVPSLWPRVDLVDPRPRADNYAGFSLGSAGRQSQPASLPEPQKFSSTTVLSGGLGSGAPSQAAGLLSSAVGGEDTSSKSKPAPAAEINSFEALNKSKSVFEPQQVASPFFRSPPEASKNLPDSQSPFGSLFPPAQPGSASLPTELTTVEENEPAAPAMKPFSGFGSISLPTPSPVPGFGSTPAASSPALTAPPLGSKSVQFAVAMGSFGSPSARTENALSEAEKDAAGKPFSGAAFKAFGSTESQQEPAAAPVPSPSADSPGGIFAASAAASAAEPPKPLSFGLPLGTGAAFQTAQEPASGDAVPEFGTAAGAPASSPSTGFGFSSAVSQPAATPAPAMTFGSASFGAGFSFGSSITSGTSSSTTFQFQAASSTSAAPATAFGVIPASGSHLSTTFAPPATAQPDIGAAPAANPFFGSFSSSAVTFGAASVTQPQPAAVSGAPSPAAAAPAFSFGFGSGSGFGSSTAPAAANPQPAQFSFGQAQPNPAFQFSQPAAPANPTEPAGAPQFGQFGQAAPPAAAPPQQAGNPAAFGAGAGQAGGAQPSMFGLGGGGAPQAGRRKVRAKRTTR